MRFWDSSALVPLVVEEPGSAAYRRVLRQDDRVAIWILTRVEIVCALRRKARDGDLDPGPLTDSLRRMQRLATSWTEIEQVGVVRDHAERLVAVHPLRSADALQLGAALAMAQGRPRGRSFVTGDSRLAAAAEAEGFEPIVPAG